MSLWQAILLGLVQGLTEFLPISSTAHLRIVPALLGWTGADGQPFDPGAAFTAITQLGTLMAVLIYFARDLVRVTAAGVMGLVRRQPFATADSRMAWYIAVGTIPVVVLGLLLKGFIENEFRSLYVMASSLIALAVVLFIVERRAPLNRDLTTLTWGDAITVGLAQTVALIPGASRSGTTITGGFLRGLNREAAARFSFLLSIPAVLGAGLYELYKFGKLYTAFQHPERYPTGLADLTPQIRLELAALDPTLITVATVVAGISGFLVIAGLLRFLRTHSMTVFIVYRIALGLLLLALLISGRLAAN